MLEKLRVIFTIPELRRKIMLTLLLLAIYRVGWQIPLPVVDAEAMRRAFQTQQGGVGALLEQVAIFSASNLQEATIFGLGIMPYISASIIFQLLSTVIPSLERLRKEEGEAGRRKLNEYTRYATIGLCIFQSWFYLAVLVRSEFIREQFINPETGQLSLAWQLTAVMTMTAGTAFLMWLGEQIDEYGIGNGISLLIMAGILARLPSALWSLLQPVVTQGLELGSAGGNIGVDKLLVLIALFVGVVAGVVYMERAQRRIPTQSAKHVRGRRVYGGARQYLPLKINQGGVMPIVFASSLLLFPSVIFQWLAHQTGASWALQLDLAFRRGESYVYNVFYILLIYFFCYFWTAIVFNPKDMAENLQNYGTFIPGYRPGRRTAEFLEKVMIRITFVGAGFLAIIAVIPTIIATWMRVDWVIASFYGGTSLLIAVSVAFDLVQRIDSYLVMHNYKGLLER